MPTAIPGPPPLATTTVNGLVSTVAQSFAGAKTFTSSIVAEGAGSTFADPAVRIPITSGSQLHLLQFGGLTNLTWEMALGYYGPALAPVIQSRAQNLYISLASGRALAPFAPNINDIGDASNYWRNVYGAAYRSIGTGSATAVSYGPNGDDNTGLWFPAADTINIVTGGTLRTQISATGAMLHQGPLSIPTNTLLSLGASTLYEPSAGILQARQWLLFEDSTNSYMRAGVSRSAVLISPIGTVAAEVAVKVGTLQSQAATHVDAELLRVATGLGTSENGRMAVYKGAQTFGFELGAPGMPSTARLKLDNAVGWNLSYNATGGALTIDSAKYRLSSGAATGLIIDSSSNSQIISPGKVLYIYASGSSAITETIRLVSNRGDSGLKCVVAGTENATPNDGAVLFQVAYGLTTAANDAGNGTAVRRWTATGLAWTRGTDDSATIGDSTVNRPSGINTLASGATTCVITNNLVPNPATRKIRINIQWRADHGAARSWVTQGTGSFTVNLSAAAGANTEFSWDLEEIL